MAPFQFDAGRPLHQVLLQNDRLSLPRAGGTFLGAIPQQPGRLESRGASGAGGPGLPVASPSESFSAKMASELSLLFCMREVAKCAVAIWLKL